MTFALISILLTSLDYHLPTAIVRMTASASAATLCSSPARSSLRLLIDVHLTTKFSATTVDHLPVYVVILA